MPPSPAATRPHPQPTPGANREIAGQGKSAYLAEAVIAREAAKVDAALNLGLGGFRLRKLVRRFVREGRTDIDFRTWFLCYADPTGETAVRNVLRGGGAHDGAA